MAPEQVRGAARADERADIYAVGAVAFRSLSGRLPFEGNTAAVLVAMKLDRSAPSLAEATGEQWPSGIERFLERALERTRERRFDSAAQALAMWRSIQPSAIRGSAPPPTPEAEGAVLAAQGRVPEAPPSRTRAVIPARAVRGPSEVIPAPTKLAPAPAIAPVPSVAPTAPRAPISPATPSYEVVEDSPTDVDGPPEMTMDGLPADDAHGGASRDNEERR
jgi:serine/threonine-protein kinase